MTPERGYRVPCGGKFSKSPASITRPLGPPTTNRQEWYAVGWGDEPASRNNLPGHDSVKVTTSGPIAPRLTAVLHVALIPRGGIPGPGRLQFFVVSGVLGKIRRIGHEACTCA